LQGSCADRKMIASEPLIFGLPDPSKSVLYLSRRRGHQEPQRCTVAIERILVQLPVQKEKPPQSSASSWENRILVGFSRCWSGALNPLPESHAPVSKVFANASNPRSPVSRACSFFSATPSRRKCLSSPRLNIGRHRRLSGSRPPRFSSHGPQVFIHFAPLNALI
jgi:hypothetical protein